MVTRTDGRWLPPSPSTTSAGTAIPVVVLPASLKVVRNLIPRSVSPAAGPSLGPRPMPRRGDARPVVGCGGRVVVPRTRLRPAGNAGSGNLGARHATSTRPGDRPWRTYGRNRSLRRLLVHRDRPA